MPPRAVPPLLAALAAAFCAVGCGDEPAPPPAEPDLRGTPFLVPASAPVPPEAAIGDLDPLPAAETAETLRPPVAEPVRPVAKAPGEAAPAAVAGDALELTWDELSGFECAAYASTERAPIPEKIAALSGKEVLVDGYMMPLVAEAGGAKKFLLMRYKFGCCYTVTPKINEWIEVTMEKGVADYIPDTLVTVRGVLEVVEELRDGAATGLYRMRGTRSEFTEAK